MKKYVFLFVLIFAALISCQKEETSVKEKLWYNAPSANWFEALPLGK
jgi:hypothetical protein